MERTYGSLVRHELGSSYSALDGIPFKIGRAFRRPERISPPQLLLNKTDEAVSQEYTFETEEAVLAWAKARDEAVKKAAEEQALRLKNKEIHKGEAEDSHIENDGILSSNADLKESVYDVPRYTVSQPKNDDYLIKPPLPPKVSSLSTKPVPEAGTVLTPIPIKPLMASSVDKETSSTAESKSKVDSQFDLAMFEAEADPFDNLELQTLNDMEELKVLLNSNSVNAHCDSSVVQEVSAHALDSCTVALESSADELEGTNQSEQKAQIGMGSYTKSDVSKPAENQDGTSQSIATSVKTYDDGEYVEIIPKYKDQNEPSHVAMDVSSGGKPTPLNGLAFHRTNPAVDGSFLTSGLNSQIYKPVLPPINKSTLSTDIGLCQSVPGQQATGAHHGNSSCDTASTQKWNSPFVSPREGGKGLPLQQSNGRELVSSSPPPTTQSIKPSRPAPPPPVGSKPMPRNKTPVQSSDVMSSSTGPSLAMFLGNSGQSEERSVQSPYNRHSNSTSDLNVGPTSKGVDSPRRNSAVISPQPWNRHVPLPPPPSRVNSAQSLGLSDPYSSLSREEQAFTDILTNMGFLRPRVARAVQKFGSKEKEVLDHLLAADKLGEQRYAPVMIESALFTFKNDLEKAERFLQLHAQFEELGFQREKIHDALISTDLEHDKALDILTA